MAGLALVSSPLLLAQSELVFQDNFDVNLATWDINEGLAGRQSGSAAVVSYTEAEETAAGGTLDDFTQIYNDGTGTRLSLIVVESTWVSPDRNFTDGPVFTIEFDLNPSVLDPGRLSEDWAAIVFGATRPGQFVNSSDGMGILFRSNGLIQVFDGANLVHGNTEETALPAGEIHVRIEVVGEGFDGTADATVKLFVNGDPVPLTDTGDAYVRPGGFRGNYLTLLGYATEGNQWEYLFDNLTVRADTCVRMDPELIVLDENAGPDLSVTVRVPENFNNGQGGTVTVSSSNPGVVSIVGATDNALALDFPAGTTAKTVNLKVVGQGRVHLQLATDAPDCLGGTTVILTPLKGIVRNPSFEQNYNPTWPHYGPVNEWEGGSGVNGGDGPFHDNGPIPDRARIAFLQTTQTISQQIRGLEPGKNYWLQVRYNSRNCCGGEVPDMTVSVDGTPLGTEESIQPANGPYYFRNFEFVAADQVALVEISTQPHSGGDSTLLIDAVTVVQRDDGNVVVQNPSFEASGLVPLPGVFTEQNISGWQIEGTAGLNLSGDPFADNGTTPDQDLVAFIQGAGALSQTLVGLIPGETYEVSFAYNARSGNTPRLVVTAGDSVVFEDDVTPVGTGAYHRASGTFVATEGSAVLRFAQTAEGDQTVLLDDIRVKGQAVNLPCIQLAPETLQLGVGQVSSAVTVKVLEDVVANGPTTVTVTSSDPTVALLPGAVDGVLTLHFDANQLVQTVEVAGVAQGVATLKFDEPRGVCFDKAGVNVMVLGSLIRNPSFEDNSHATFPGYGPIAAWDSEGSGNTGINDATGPFHDNGVIPDRNQIALLQTARILRQEVVGLTPGKHYWLQFYYNVRNCCGGSIDLMVRFAGTDLDIFPAIAPVMESNPYHFAQLEFTAGGSSGMLEFETVSDGDATVLLDAITIVQRDAGGIVVRNPSFEASGLVPFPGYIEGNIAGWDSDSAGRGVNLVGVGPFADNGAPPDQDSVLFLQNAGAYVSQTLEGLIPGRNYTVRFQANARSGNAPKLKVMFDDYVAYEQTITPVGGQNPFHTIEVVVPAAAETGVLRFEQTADGDQTVLIDNVVVTPGGTLPPPEVRLNVALQDGKVRLSWPANADGFVLQETAVLPGGWKDSDAPTSVEGDEKVVTIEPAGASQFYRLRQ